MQSTSAVFGSKGLYKAFKEDINMSGIELTLGIVLIIFAVAIITVVLFQEGRQQNMGAISGGSSDTFLSKHKTRSIDTFLARWTRFIAVIFFLLVILINAITYFKFV